MSISSAARSVVCDYRVAERKASDATQRERRADAAAFATAAAGTITCNSAVRYRC